jgi:hypothetical protein
MVADEMTTTTGSRPVPDPTELTDKAIAKAVTLLTQYVDGKLETVNERIDGIDVATQLRLGTVSDLHDDIDEKIKAEVSHLADLTNERFTSAERLRVEQKKDTKDAVDAALSAAKEAVKEQTTASGLSISKSETATREQLQQQQATFTTSIEGLRRSIDELKDREIEDIRNLRQLVADVATTANGSVREKAGGAAERTSIFAVVGLVLAVAAFVVGRLS